MNYGFIKLKFLKIVFENTLFDFKSRYSEKIFKTLRPSTIFKTTNLST